jgi:hypothetical protein
MQTYLKRNRPGRWDNKKAHKKEAANAKKLTLFSDYRFIRDHVVNSSLHQPSRGPLPQ